MSSNTLHVHPENDLIEHDTSTSEADCPCGPETRREVREDGTDAGWIIVHHALDNREVREREA